MVENLLTDLTDGDIAELMHLFAEKALSDDGQNYSVSNSERSGRKNSSSTSFNPNAVPFVPTSSKAPPKPNPNAADYWPTSPPQDDSPRGQVVLHQLLKNLGTNLGPMTASQAAAGLQTIIQAAGAANDPSTLFMLSDVLSKQAQAMVQGHDSSDCPLPNTKVVSDIEPSYAFDINQRIWKYKDPSGKEQVEITLVSSVISHVPHSFRVWFSGTIFNFRDALMACQGIFQSRHAVVVLVPHTFRV
jgi:hypothetical protein